MDSGSRMVYQMRLAVDPSKRWGWIFGTEEDEGEQDQTFLYTVPLSSREDDWHIHTYLFPGLKGDQYLEFVAEPQGDTLVVNADGVNVRFAPYSVLSQIDPSPVPQSTGDNLQYIGKDNLVEPFIIFMPIYPLDTMEMEVLYKEKGVVLVGLTPLFHAGAYSHLGTDGP